MRRRRTHTSPWDLVIMARWLILRNGDRFVSRRYRSAIERVTKRLRHRLRCVEIHTSRWRRSVVTVIALVMTVIAEKSWRRRWKARTRWWSESWWRRWRNGSWVTTAKSTWRWLWTKHRSVWLGSWRCSHHFFLLWKSNLWERKKKRRTRFFFFFFD